MKNIFFLLLFSISCFTQKNIKVTLEFNNEDSLFFFQKTTIFENGSELVEKSIKYDSLEVESILLSKLYSKDESINNLDAQISDIKKEFKDIDSIIKKFSGKTFKNYSAKKLQKELTGRLEVRVTDSLNIISKYIVNLDSSGFVKGKMIGKENKGRFIVKSNREILFKNFFTENLTFFKVHNKFVFKNENWKIVIKKG